MFSQLPTSLLDKNMIVLLTMSLGWSSPDSTSVEQPNPASERLQNLSTLAESLESEQFVDEAIEAYKRLFYLSKDPVHLQKQIDLHLLINQREQAYVTLEIGLVHLNSNQQNAFKKHNASLYAAMSEMKNTEPQVQTVELNTEMDDSLYLSRKQWQRTGLIVLGSLGILGGAVMGTEAIILRNNMHQSGAVCYKTGQGTSVCNTDAPSQLDRQKLVAGYSDFGWFIAALSFGLNYYLHRDEVILEPTFTNGESQ